MVRFQSLAHFPIDYLFHTDVESLVLFWVTLLHSFIIWLIVLSLSPNNLHLLFLLRYRLSFSYNWSIWCCSVLLWEKIQFLSWNFSFVAMSSFFVRNLTSLSFEISILFFFIRVSKIQLFFFLYLFLFMPLLAALKGHLCPFKCSPRDLV